MPLPDKVQCCAIATLITREHGNLSAKLVDDGLVPMQSALGQHNENLACSLRKIKSCSYTFDSVLF